MTKVFVEQPRLHQVCLKYIYQLFSFCFEFETVCELSDILIIYSMASKCLLKSFLGALRCLAYGSKLVLV